MLYIDRALMNTCKVARDNLSIFVTQDEQKSITEVEKLAKDKSPRAREMLKKLLLSHYPEGRQTPVTLTDLLSWKFWPPLIKVYGKV